MEVLATYLRTNWPDGLSLDDAVQLCMHVYCTGEGIPAGLRPLASRERLARTFVALAASGWIRRPGPDVDVSTVEFWSTVVASATKQVPWRYDAVRGRMLAARFVA